MTDREQIANHEGWVKYCADNRKPMFGDLYFLRVYGRRLKIRTGLWCNGFMQTPVPNIILYTPASHIRGDKYEDDDEDICGNGKLSKHIIPIPREDQLMDMLEAKGKNSFKYFKHSTHYTGTGETKYDWTFEFQPNKNHSDPLKHAPTRLLALFKAVCRIYALDGKME